MLFTLVFKQIGGMKWSLGISMAAFFGLSILWDSGVSQFQYPPNDVGELDSKETSTTPVDNEQRDEAAEEDATISLEDSEASLNAEESDQPEPSEEPESSDRDRRSRRPQAFLYVFMGVPQDQVLGVTPNEIPTRILESCVANHPLVLLTILGWGIARAAGSVAGEIERGTLDLTLSRPVRRITYLSAQIVTTTLVFLLLGGTLVGGHLISPFFFELNNPPTLLDFGPLLTMIVGFGLAVFGYSLVASSADLSRTRAGMIGLGLTLTGIAGYISAQQYENYPWLANISVFEYYAPVGATIDGFRSWQIEFSVLYGTFAVGCFISMLIFRSRDLPTSG